MSGKLQAEADAGNTITATYIWGKDRLLIKQLASGAQYYYLYNGHGDVIQITDSAGNIVNSYEYDEWGNITSQIEGIENEFKYAGQTYDSETGLYYLRARYYDPTTGRFISKDSNEGSIVNPLSLNLYTYCVNNPIKYVDPSGNIPVETLADLISIGWSVSDLIKDPSWGNAGYLIWDIGATIVPYAPGSYVAKGAKAIGKIDDVADAGKTAGKTKWDIKTNAKSEISYNFNGQKVKAYQDNTKKGYFWAKDTTGHGGSTYKVFEKKGNELHWVADADEYGNFIANKHKSTTGMVIKLK